MFSCVEINNIELFIDANLSTKVDFDNAKCFTTTLRPQTVTSSHTLDDALFTPINMNGFTLPCKCIGVNRAKHAVCLHS